MQIGKLAIVVSNKYVVKIISIFNSWNIDITSSITIVTVVTVVARGWSGAFAVWQWQTHPLSQRSGLTGLYKLYNVSSAVCIVQLNVFWESALRLIPLESAFVLRVGGEKWTSDPIGGKLIAVLHKDQTGVWFSTLLIIGDSSPKAILCIVNKWYFFCWEDQTKTDHDTDLILFHDCRVKAQLRSFRRKLIGWEIAELFFHWFLLSENAWTGLDTIGEKSKQTWSLNPGRQRLSRFSHDASTLSCRSLGISDL